MNLPQSNTDLGIIPGQQLNGNQELIASPNKLKIFN
jgi:hypothetical protein